MVRCTAGIPVDVPSMLYLPALQKLVPRADNVWFRCGTKKLRCVEVNGKASNQWEGTDGFWTQDCKTGSHYVCLGDKNVQDDV